MLFIEKEALAQPYVFNFPKKETLHRCFPANFVKFVKTPFLQNIFGSFFCIMGILFIAGGLHNWANNTLN